MSVIVRVDERGRVVIPKSIREKVKLKEGNYVNIRVEGRKNSSIRSRTLRMFSKTEDKAKVSRYREGRNL